jgi:hypothetical protein
MQVVTTFFNNETYHQENLIRWYNKIWDTKQYIFFIGKEKLEHTSFALNGILFNVVDDGNIRRYEYQSGTNTPDQWNNYKAVFYDIIRQYHRIYPSLWIDCDELIFCKNIQSAINDGFVKTHFYEYVPVKPFSFNSETLWSACGWYYREQSLGNTQPTHVNCKRFSLDPHHQFQHMGGGNDYCKHNAQPDDYENICYHVGVYSNEHFLKSKHWMQTHPQGIEISETDRQALSSLQEIFEAHYTTCKFDTFTLNLKEKYNL